MTTLSGGAIFYNVKQWKQYGSAILLAAAVFFTAAIGLYVLSRAFFTSARPFMRGGELVSPDGQFMASLMGVYDEVFFGPPKTYYLFRIYRREKNVDRIEATRSNWVFPPLKSITIDNPPGERHRMVRGALPFQAEWSEDSSGLSIDFFDTTFVMRTSLSSEDQRMEAVGGSTDSITGFYNLRIQVENSEQSANPAGR